MFVSGNLALDLAGTLKWRRDVPEEHLAEPSDLAAWLVGAGVLDSRPAAGAAELSAAIRLREAAYVLAADRAAGRSPDPAALDVVNAFAAEPPVRLTFADGGLRRAGDVAAGLSEVARALLPLLGDDGEDVVKECAKPACTRLFADRSRGHRRTWCGMQECGSQAKMAAYRARRRAQATGS